MNDIENIPKPSTQHYPRLETTHKSAHETEFTLGSLALAGLGCGLVFLCALCFFFGYVTGHHLTSSTADTAKPIPPAQTIVTQTLAPKPPAAAAVRTHNVSPSATPAADAAPADEPAQPEAESTQAATPHTPGIVRPALPAESAPPAPEGTPSTPAEQSPQSH